jgi:hypothetical protein
MSRRRVFIIEIALVNALLGAISCTTAVVTPFPQTVRRIAVLPPYQRGGETLNPSMESDVLRPLKMNVGDALAQQARVRLAEKGFEILNPSVVKIATKDRMPTSLQMATQIMREAGLDAAAMYIEVRRWEPTPDARGMKADGIIVALDVMLVDPKTGAVLWEVHRPSRPVPLHGVFLTGQANVFVAETVMQEVLASVGSRQPSG